MKLPVMSLGVQRSATAKPVAHGVEASGKARENCTCHCNWTCSNNDKGEANGPPGSKLGCLKGCAGTALSACRRARSYVQTYNVDKLECD